MEDKIDQHKFKLNNGGSLPIRKAFLGKCLGVVLTNRMSNDPHVVLIIVSEFQDQWYATPNHIGFSSYWLEELRAQMELAQKWMKDNCDPHEGGWKFKENYEYEYGF